MQSSFGWQLTGLRIGCQLFFRESGHFLSAVRGKALVLDKNVECAQLHADALKGIFIGAGEGVEMNPFGKKRQRRGRKCLGTGDKLLNIVAAGKVERACELTINRVFYDHIQYDAAVIYHDAQLLLHSVTVVTAGYRIEQTALFAVQKVAFGGGRDIYAGGAQQCHIAHDHLAADTQLFGEGGGTDRGAGKLQ